MLVCPALLTDAAAAAQCCQLLILCCSLLLPPGPCADIRVVGIAAGMSHSLALTANGEVYSWGDSAHGRLGHGAPPSLRLFSRGLEFKPRLIRALETLRIKRVHWVLCGGVPAAHMWGCSGYSHAWMHVVGDSNRHVRSPHLPFPSLPCPSPLQISAGQMHSAAVSSSGDAFLWGYGKFHQLGFGDDHDQETPTPLPPLKGNTVAVACGSLHSLALQYGGDVLSWGANQVGGCMFLLAQGSGVCIKTRQDCCWAGLGCAVCSCAHAHCFATAERGAGAWARTEWTAQAALQGARHSGGADCGGVEALGGGDGRWQALHLGLGRQPG